MWGANIFLEEKATIAVAFGFVARLWKNLSTPAPGNFYIGLTTITESRTP